MQRSAANPLITPAAIAPSRPELEVLCTFNPGAVRVGDETLLLVRVAERPVPERGYVSYARLAAHGDPPEIAIHHLHADDPDLDTRDPRLVRYRGQVLLTSISHLRLARSRDGEHFTIDPAPTIAPREPYESYGIEDPRITPLDGRYWINYSAISEQGVCTALMSTSDFIDFERHGVIFAPNNKDIAIFPEKIKGRYVCRHRPNPGEIGMPAIWTAWSDNLLDWGGHRYTMGPRAGGWDCERVGCGAPPIKTERGWLELYHASDFNVRYCVGAMLTALDDPTRVLARCAAPVLAPEADYERRGLMPDVVFHNGLTVDGDVVNVYYGAADTVVACARFSLEELLGSLREA